MARVTIVKGNRKDLSYTIVKETIIGRSSQNAIPLDDTKTSRQHTKIYMENENYFIEDLGSRNGTLVNGKYINEKKQLNCGDEIEVGETTFLFSLDEFSQTSDNLSSKNLFNNLPQNLPPLSEQLETLSTQADEKGKFLKVKLETSLPENLVKIRSQKNSDIKIRQSKKILTSKKALQNSLLRQFLQGDFLEYSSFTKLLITIFILLVMLILSFGARWITLFLLS